MQCQVIFGVSALFLLVLRMRKVKKTNKVAMYEQFLAIAMSEQQPMMSEQTVLWSDKLQVAIYFHPWL